MRSLRDAAKELKKMDVRVLGISTDAVAAIQAFHKAQKLGFDLLSDPDAAAAKAYMVFVEKWKAANRVTFIIDPEGVVRHIDEKVQCSSHGKDIVPVIKKLREEAKRRERERQKKERKEREKKEKEEREGEGEKEEGGDKE